MGSKRKNSLENQPTESTEERHERKRLKKEAKKRNSSSAGADREDDAVDANNNNDAHTDGTTTGQISPLFTKQNIKLTVSLLPIHLKNKEAAIHKAIAKSLLRYSHALKGVMLSFENVKILNNQHGSLVMELPHVHYSVTCTACLFRPAPGLTIQRGGICNSQFYSHLSIIVFKYFNASISAQELRQAGMEFDMNSEQWYRVSDEQFLELGKEIQFSVAQVHESGGLISIDGVDPVFLENE
mmetsp:Transcript_11683/g.15377  ORF Transcript_11683/g.15377 Transcript_11683/m.15377 type:complete len:241 (-) Transcript_11683:18-740(-)|eukprot:CAMPEP_0198140700 /NCGR_PEP_ID=MMETSP1443-20131203/3832_1 /TAXON_ID=186043 /ORGANISM="Entomoneis sp., Strain CCMP2396" /LENGTH=240 /DNA_ID=CAMNT_0043803211 /DNA_START=170 /DNA_END=892 /DNA_ORIENTATION=+